jgi:hypothetical protein
MSLYPDWLIISGRRYREQLAPRFRLAWDDQNPDYDYKSRTLTYPGVDPSYNAPAVMQYYPIRDERARERINLEADSSWRWKDTIIAINGGGEVGARAWGYLVGPSRAQFNDTGWARMAYLSMCGNVVNVLETVGSWYKIETLKGTDWMRARSMTIESHPHLIHRFTCVSWKDGETVRINSTGTPRGQVYCPLVTWAVYAWIPARHVVKATN